MKKNYESDKQRANPKNNLVGKAKKQGSDYDESEEEDDVSDFKSQQNKRLVSKSSKREHELDSV